MGMYIAISSRNIYGHAGENARISYKDGDHSVRVFYDKRYKSQHQIDTWEGGRSEFIPNHLKMYDNTGFKSVRKFDGHYYRLSFEHDKKEKMKKWYKKGHLHRIKFSLDNHTFTLKPSKKIQVRKAGKMVYHFRFTGIQIPNRFVWNNDRVLQRANFQASLPTSVISRLVLIQAKYENGVKLFESTDNSNGSLKTYYSKTGEALISYEMGKELIVKDKSGNVLINSTPSLLEIKSPSGNIVRREVYENNQIVGIAIQKGIEVFYISGQPVAKELYYKKPEDITSEEVLNTQNANLRAGLLRRMGYERFLSLSKAEVINESGNGNALYHVNMGESLEPLALLVVICPTTKSKYVLRVHPELKTAEDARQWTFKDDFSSFQRPYGSHWSNVGMQENMEHLDFSSET